MIVGQISKAQNSLFSEDQKFWNYSEDWNSRFTANQKNQSSEQYIDQNSKTEYWKSLKGLK
jgi:hypothetical protein